MKNLTLTTKAYILGTILVGLGLIAWTTLTLDWTNPWLYVTSVLGALAQTLKVEGPNARTNYSIAWLVYGFAFLALGLEAAVFVILIAHLVEWLWHRYPWYIQSFNIGAHILPLYLAGLALEAISRGTQAFDLVRVLGLASANLIFVFTNHFLVGLVVKLARGQSFADSGVFEYLTISLDFTSLSVGNVTALTWALNPYLGLLTVLPLFLLYQALRLPALLRRVKEQEL